MLDNKVSELLNAQVNKEFFSAYLYMDFSNYYYEQGLDGLQGGTLVNKPPHSVGIVGIIKAGAEPVTPAIV